MIEASRILLPGGLFVLKGASNEDLLLAQTLGLRLIAHRPMTSKEDDILYDTTPKEIILQKQMYQLD